MAGRRNRADYTFALINDAFPHYYEILGVAHNATRRDITQAYRSLALSEHPDKSGSTPAANERFANINQARDVLSDPDMRKDYDKQLYQAEQEAERERRRVEADRRRTQAGPAQSSSGTGPEPAESAFAHSFTRWGGPFRPTQFTAWANNPRFPFGMYGTPDVPKGEGAWAGRGQNDLVWKQAAELWAACSSLCNLAATIQSLLTELESVARAAVPKDKYTAFITQMPDNHAQKFHCGIDILWEILRFSGSGYVVVKRSVESMKQRSPADAMAEMNKLMVGLDKFHKQMLSTERTITMMGTQIVGRTADATTLWGVMELLCRQWDRLIELPHAVQDRINEIFRAGSYQPG